MLAGRVPVGREEGDNDRLAPELFESGSALYLKIGGGSADLDRVTVRKGYYGDGALDPCDLARLREPMDTPLNPSEIAGYGTILRQWSRDYSPAV